MTLAARKSRTAMTQALQTLEGAACMNNTFCLGIFYVLIWLQGLAWKFTAETLVIFFIQVLVFILVIKSNTQTMKEAYIIFACYPAGLIVLHPMFVCADVEGLKVIDGLPCLAQNGQYC